MWEDQLLVSPVVKEGFTTVEAFIPNDIWYDLHSGAPVVGHGKKVMLKAPLDTINVHIRGGSILPLLPPTVRTDVSRSQNYTIVVAPGSDRKAAGQLFWDDGENRDSVTAGEFSLVDFTLDGNTLSSVATKSVYVPGIGLHVDQVVFLGVKVVPSRVTVN